MPAPRRPAYPNPHWIKYDVYGDAMRDSDPRDWAADGWTYPVLAPIGAGPAFGYAQGVEDAVNASPAMNWQGAEDLIEEPWFANARYSLRRRYQLPAINAVVYFKVLPLLGFMGPISPSHPIQAAADWANAQWTGLSKGSKKKIGKVAPLSAEGWGRLANALIQTVKDNKESISHADRVSLMQIAEASLAAMDKCVTLAETLAKNTGLRPVWHATWDTYRQVNIIVGLGDPGDAQGSAGGSKDLTGKDGPWLLRNMKWIAPLGLLAVGGFYVAPILAPLLNVAGKARSRAVRETKRLESKAAPILDSDERSP